MNIHSVLTASDRPARPNIFESDKSEVYDDVDIYDITQTTDYLTFVRIVMKLGPTFDLMLYMALASLFLASIILYHAGFESPALMKHQMVIVGLVILIQASVAANTFLIKQTVVNGNFTPALQISTLPDDENPTPRGHLLFLNSLYKGSFYITLFLTISFSSLIVYSVYHIGSNFDFITMTCFLGFIAFNALSSIISFRQQKKVAKLLLSTFF